MSMRFWNNSAAAMTVSVPPHSLVVCRLCRKLWICSCSVDPLTVASGSFMDAIRILWNYWRLCLMYSAICPRVSHILLLCSSLRMSVLYNWWTIAEKRQCPSPAMIFISTAPPLYRITSILLDRWFRLSIAKVTRVDVFVQHWIVFKLQLMSIYGCGLRYS